MRRFTSHTIAIAVSATGHFLLHLILGIYAIVVLVLQSKWGQSYSYLISLWTFGALLLGLGAPLAGWLSDRWGEVNLMIVFFLGTGAATVLTALGSNPTSIALSLAAIGLFGSIYHPVGTSLAIRNARGHGKVIGIVGLFGGLGLAVSAPVASALVGIDWRLAFIAPGSVALLVGIATFFLRMRGLLRDRREDLRPGAAPQSRRVMARVFYSLSLSMLLFSVIYSAFTTALPKWLDDQVAGRSGSLFGIGLLVALIYSCGIVAQLVGGWVADHWSAKWAYVASFIGKGLLLAAASLIRGWPSVLIACFIVFLFDVASPAENVLIARFSPAGQRGLIYGLRHGIGLVAGPLGVQCVSLFYGWKHDFSLMLVVLAGLALVVALAGMSLPPDHMERMPRRTP
jgi:FSR family fosmidomycin resistance protein-like MFS transporter